MLSSVQVAAFVKEAAGIAKKKKREPRLYSPGVVAHEAGHAYVHRHAQDPKKKKFDVMGAVEMAGTLLPAGVAGYQMATKGGYYPRDLAAAAAIGYTPRLVDEYASSFRGYKGVKQTKAFKQLDRGGLKKERNRLVAAGATYGLMPAALLSVAADKPLGAAAATVGQVGALALATKEDGPKITAREAKALAQEIAPGVRVYASKEPFAGGSAYMAPPRTSIGRALADESLKPYLAKGERKKFVQEGGLLIAPMNRGALAKGLMGSTMEMDDKFKEVK